MKDTFESGTRINEVEKNPDLPEQVFINLELRFLPLVLNFPNKKADFFLVDSAVTPQPDPPEEGFSIVLKNNGRFKLNPALSNKGLLVELKDVMPKGYYNILMELPEKAIDKPSRQTWIEFLKKFVEDNKDYLYLVEEAIRAIIKKEGTLSVSDENLYPEIAGIFYKGKYIKFEDIENYQSEILADTKLFASISAVKPGDFVYRAVNPNEWKQICADGYLNMPIETNFEGEIGDQVKLYSEDETYAGKIIRFQIKAGQYLERKGTNPQRLATISPLIAKVQVLEGGKWLEIEEYRK